MSAEPGLISEYRHPTWKRVASATSCLLIMAAAAGFALWWTPQGGANDAWLVGVLTLGALGTWLTSASYLVRRIRLYPDRVERHGLLGVSQMARNTISGFRFDGEGGFQLIDAAGARKRLSLESAVLSDPAFRQWLETLTNFDALDADAQRKAIEANPRFGATDAIRARNLRMLRGAGGMLGLLGYGVAAWAVFWPQPYAAAIVATLLAPVIAMGIARAAPGFVSFLTLVPNGAVDLFGLLLPPIGAVSIRAFYDAPTPDWVSSLPYACGVTALVVALLAVTSCTRQTIKDLASFACLAFPWAWSALLLANAQIGQSVPALITTTVVERHGKKDDDPRVTVRTAGAASETFHDLAISRGDFDAARPGTRVCVCVRTGALGWRILWTTSCRTRPSAVSAQSS